MINGHSRARPEISGRSIRGRELRRASWAGPISSLLFFMFVFSLHLEQADASCATQPAPTQPTLIYFSLGGPASSSPPCPKSWSGPGGTIAQFMNCSATWLQESVPEYGPFTYTGETFGDNEVELWWESKGNGAYASYMQPAPSSNTCPEYWVVAPPPPMAETCSADCVGKDPINPGTGAVYDEEEDIRFGRESPIVFRRFYDSADASGADGVPGWRHSYD